MSTTSPSPYERYRPLPSLLLTLHKSLMDRAFHKKERELKRELAPGEKLQLLLGGADYQWLRPLSQFISEIEEGIQGKNRLEPAALEQLVGRVEAMITRGEVKEASIRELGISDADWATFSAPLKTFFVGLGN